MMDKESEARRSNVVDKLMLMVVEAVTADQHTPFRTGLPA
jgi:hypothetical protein